MTFFRKLGFNIGWGWWRMCGVGAELIAPRLDRAVSK
jgi:hypothetical protein